MLRLLFPLFYIRFWGETKFFWVLSHDHVTPPTDLKLVYHCNSVFWCFVVWFLKQRTLLKFFSGKASLYSASNLLPTNGLNWPLKIWTLSIFCVGFGYLKGTSCSGTTVSGCNLYDLRLSSKLRSVAVWLFGPLACCIKWWTLAVLPVYSKSMLLKAGALPLEYLRLTKRFDVFWLAVPINRFVPCFEFNSFYWFLTVYALWNFFESHFSWSTSKKPGGPCISNFANLLYSLFAWFSSPSAAFLLFLSSEVGISLSEFLKIVSLSPWCILSSKVIFLLFMLTISSSSVGSNFCLTILCSGLSFASRSSLPLEMTNASSGLILRWLLIENAGSSWPKRGY